MKLHLASSSGQNLITGYGRGFVAINHARYEKSLIVLREKLIEDWDVTGFAQLGAAHFEFLAGLDPEIVLLGTGATLRFPHPSLSRSLTAAQVGMEVMDTGAACRTFNILAAEGRQVAAALLIE